MKPIILDNGITLHLDHVKEAKTMGLNILVEIGSIYEPKNKRGISHFLEHMLFKSNKKYTYKEIASGLEMNGGISNAITSTLATFYIFEFIPKSFGKITDIVFHMFANEKYKQEEFESEKKVVLTEIERYLNDPESRLWDLSLQALYGKSDYGEPIQGFRETVESVEKEQLEEYKARYYSPENMHIILSGNFSQKHVQMVKKIFSKKEENSVKKKKPKKSKGKNLVINLATQNQIYYSLNFSVKEDLHKIIGFQNFISPGFSSLLSQIFREKYGIGYTLFFGYNKLYPENEAAISLLVPGFEKEKSKELKLAIRELFETLKKENLEEYYKGRKRMLKLKYEKTRINIFERLYESYKMILLCNENYDRFMKKVFSLDPEEIIEFALKLKRGKEVVIRPSK